MIARHTGSPEDQNEALLDITAASAYCSRRPVRTIRKHCEPAACDTKTRVLLYNTTDLNRILDLQRRVRAAA